jgi:amino-acid N-acetyltransferase
MLSVRASRRGDLKRVLGLLRSVGLPSAGVRSSFDNFLVAEEGGHLVGCAGLELFGDSAMLRSVAVHPPLQRRGIGSRLVVAAIATAKSRGVDRIFLLTQGQAGFFKRLGFREVNRGDFDQAVRKSVLYTRSCPLSATGMRLEIPRDA